MSDAQTSTTVEQPAAPAPAPTEITEKNITLDDVYRDSGLDKIEETPQPSPQPQPAQPPAAPEPSRIPDPYDSENFKAYMARKDSETTALRQAYGNMAQFLTTIQARDAKQALESDIKSAVERVNADVGHPKPKVVEAMLDAAARENPKFKAIWDNRKTNPVALDNALKVLSKQFAEDLSVKVDPALVEAQRARKAAQKAMATTTTESGQSPAEERLAAAQGADFDAEWSKLLSGGA